MTEWEKGITTKAISLIGYGQFSGRPVGKKKPKARNWKVKVEEAVGGACSPASALT